MAISNDRKLSKLDDVLGRLLETRGQLSAYRCLLLYDEQDLMALGVKTKIGHAINSINSADAELSMVIEDMETAISDLGDRMSAEEDREERRASKKTKTAKKRK